MSAGNRRAPWPIASPTVVDGPIASRIDGKLADKATRPATMPEQHGHGGRHVRPRSLAAER